MDADDYEQLAFEQLRAAQRALSAEQQEAHERQANFFAAKARETEGLVLEAV
jgi:hypothetical protein